MKNRKWNWPVIAFIMLLIAVLLCVGCLVAGWKLTPIRGTDHADERNNDVTTSSYDNSTAEPNVFYESEPTVVSEFTVRAEVFRIIRNIDEMFYKDTFRKETIEFVRLSNGAAVMKKHIDSQVGPVHTTLGVVEISSIQGYEYQCLSVQNGDTKIYAFNENDINE